MHDCHNGVSLPPAPLPHTQSPEHAHACTDIPVQMRVRRCMRADARVHPHKHLEVNLRFEVSPFEVRVALCLSCKLKNIVRKKRKKEKNQNTRSKKDIDKIFIKFLDRCFVYFLITSSFFITSQFSTKNPLHSYL